MMDVDWLGFVDWFTNTVSQNFRRISWFANVFLGKLVWHAQISKFHTVLIAEVLAPMDQCHSFKAPDVDVEVAHVMK